MPVHLVGISRPDASAPEVAILRNDLVTVLGDITTFWSDPWSAVAAVDPAAPTLRRTDIREVPLVPDRARVLCVGLNYREHAREGGFIPPEHPTLFGRWTASLSVGDVAAPVPVDEDGLDWEGEIAAVVGSELTDATAVDALAAVFGYCTFNDLTARRAQKLTTQWTLGKNGDGSGPMGPLVTSDEVGDLRDGRRLTTRVNGTTVQDANTTDMIFDVGSILSLVSRTMTLHPGDVVATGTPSGVGYVRTPPWLLRDGDVVEVEVEGLGVLRTPIGGSRRRPIRRTTVDPTTTTQ